MTKKQAFSQRLQMVLVRYQNRSVDALQVIQEMIQIAKDLQKEPEDGISPEEVAIYDALTANDGGRAFYGWLLPSAA